jgi:hypothetical protein
MAASARLRANDRDFLPGIFEQNPTSNRIQKGLPARAKKNRA